MTESAADDRELVARMRAGDPAAFERFFATHFARLYRFALARTAGDEATAEDVVQNTLCRGVANLAGFRFESSLFTWLCTLCRHEIAAWYGRAGQRPQPVSLFEDAPEVRAALETLASGEPDDPEARLQREELARRVRVTLDALPASYGDSLEWKYIQGLTVQEIARRLDLGPKAAESLLARARAAFRSAFVIAQRRWSER